MMKEVDPLLNKLFSNVSNLQKTPSCLNRELLTFGESNVEALREEGFLRDASNAKYIECPEEGCERCVIAVQESHDNLFGYCSEYEDMAFIPLKPEDVTQSRVDFSKIVYALAAVLGNLPLRLESAERFEVCYLNGHALTLLAGAPVVLCIEEKKMPLADAMRWTGRRYCFRVERIRELIPAQKGDAETPFERRCRYLSKFMELRKWNKAVGERQKRMAEEFDESQQNVRRVLADAIKDPEVREFLNLSKLAKLELKSL